MTAFKDCAKSPTFQEAECIFECYPRDSNSQERCHCKHQVKINDTTSTEKRVNEKPKLLRFADYLHPVESVKPNLVRKCILKSLKAPAAMECHITPRPGQVSKNGTTRNEKWREATVDCKLFTRDNKDNRYSFSPQPPLDERDLNYKGFVEYFYEKEPTKSEWHLEDTAHLDKHMPKPEKSLADIDYSPYMVPGDGPSQDQQSQDFAKLFLYSGNDARPLKAIEPKISQTPAPPTTFSFGVCEIVAIACGSMVVLSLLGFCLKKLCCRNKKKNTSKKPAKSSTERQDNSSQPEERPLRVEEVASPSNSGPSDSNIQME